MAVTQLSAVKTLPYIASNVLSLFTVLPLAIAVIVFMNVANGMCYGRTLICAGKISYEIYLVHAFTLEVVSTSIMRICAFLVVTIILAALLHFGQKNLR